MFMHLLHGNASGKKSNAFKELVLCHRVMIWVFDRICSVAPLPLSNMLVVALPCSGLACTDMGMSSVGPVSTVGMKSSSFARGE